MPAEMPLFDAPQKAPSVSERDCLRLQMFLRGKGWTLRKVIAREFGWNERKVRALADKSEGYVISGNSGYRLTVEATPEDMNEFIGRQKAQVTSTQKRMLATEAVWHSRTERRPQTAA